MNNKPYILSVEDSPTDVILMKRVFKQKIASHDAIFFPDTGLAEDFLTQKHIDNKLPTLILLDIKLIKGNGLDFLLYIKTDDRFQNIPVIMLSSSDREDDKTIAKNRGCDQYVEKPRNYTQLNEQLPEIIEYWSTNNINNDTGKN